MRLTTIYEAADKTAPFALSTEYCEKYGMHDNSGIQLDCGEDISAVLFSLDLSARAIERAVKIGANCIFTHHPAIFNPLYRLDGDGAGKDVLACAKAGSSVLSAHLNLDCAAGGIDESLMKGLGGSEAECVMHALTGGGYGRVYSVKEKSLESFVRGAEETFGTKRTVFYGSGCVKRVASFCGAGADEESVRFALAHGADTFVSSDFKHHLIKELVERGVNVVALTHYSAENYGFFRFYEKLKNTLGVACEFFTDERFV